MAMLAKGMNEAGLNGLRFPNGDTVIGNVYSEPDGYGGWKIDLIIQKENSEWHYSHNHHTASLEHDLVGPMVYDAIYGVGN